MTMTAPHRGPSPLPPVAEATRGATIGLSAGAAGLAAAYAALPAQRAWLSSDHGLVDLATAVLLLVTLVVGWWGLRRTPTPDRWCRLLPLVALMGLLDELQFGSGLLGFGLPEVGPVTLDGLSSLLAAGEHLASTYLGLGPLDLAAGAGLAVALAAFLLARNHRAQRIASWLVDHPPVFHLLVSAGLVTAALALDLLGTGEEARFVEEWLEFAAAAVLLRGTLLIPGREPQALGWRQRLRPWLESDAPARSAPPSGRRRGP